ncbi:MAG: aldo/keto reductase [Thermodesulfobacteriota bacterium]
MQTLLLGSPGIRISRIVMGGWLVGRQHWAEVDDSESVRMLRAGFDAGITAVDTAESYGEGHSERIVAKALGSVRHQVAILGKVFANHLHRDAVKKACERSLMNLRTDYLDLFQVHWPSGSFGMKKVPVAETAAALAELVREGKARAVGLCNMNPEELGEYAGLIPVNAVQSPYNLFWRHAEKDVLPWCEKNGAAFLAYSPLAQGILAGRFGALPAFAPGDHRSQNRLFAPEVYPGVLEAGKRLAALADTLSLSRARLALAWVLARPGTAAVAGARSAAQACENAQAAEVTLPPQAREELSRISALVCQRLDKDPRCWFPPGKGKR